MSSAIRARLEPFKKFVRMLGSHLDGILPWTQLRLSNGAVEGMNNKIKSISHHSFGFRSMGICSLDVARRSGRYEKAMDEARRKIGSKFGSTSSPTVLPAILGPGSTERPACLETRTPPSHRWR